MRRKSRFAAVHCESFHYIMRRVFFEEILGRARGCIYIYILIMYIREDARRAKKKIRGIIARSPRVILRLESEIIFLYILLGKYMVYIVRKSV